LLFNSVHFLIFFPIVVLLYYILPQKIRWMWLLLASYFFYMSWNPKYALILTAPIVITYLSGLLISSSNKVKDDNKRIFQRRLWVTLSLSLNLLILFFFKYFDFVITNINVVLSRVGIQVLSPSFDMLLPIGVSFYIFRALCYTIDVYRNEIHAEKNLAKYALFVSFFPALIAGPIDRPKGLLAQIQEKHAFDYDKVKNGLLLMLWGYFQKVIIADNLSIIVNNVYNDYSNYSGAQIVFATVLFAIQIYCDFSGYTDIARGGAQVLGFRLMENFKQPYFAISIRDFWRRWHISLSSWFRDYVYRPLSGYLIKRKWKTESIYLLSSLTVWVLTGLWHGASWNFVIWGGLHGAYLIIGDKIKPYKVRIYSKLKINTQPFSFKLGQILTTFILVNFAWIFFKAPGTRVAISIIKRMLLDFRPSTLLDGSLLAMGLSPPQFFVIFISVVVLLVGNLMQTKMNIREALSKQNAVFRWVVYYSLLITFLILLIFIFGNFESTQFIYFQF